MNETQKRIKAYKAALPDLKERVMAMALMLVMSMAMMTSATFAWLNLSRAPELTGVATTIASNGNLEIALVPEDGSQPADTKVGDSNLPIVERNLTWGNLVNLSDTSYGLDNLTLRPAQLNTSDLAESPLYAATYGDDGRIIRLSSNFNYTTWVEPTGDIPGYFGVSTAYGVRAVSSTQAVAEMGFATEALAKQNLAKDANGRASNGFLAIAQNPTYMEGLAHLMGIHMTATLNRGESAAEAQQYRYPQIEDNYIELLIAMYEDFLKAFNEEADALTHLLNYQLFMKNGGDESLYTPYTKAMLLDRSVTTNAVLTSQGLQLADLDVFRTDYELLQSDMPVLQAILKAAKDNNGTIGWVDKIAYDETDSTKKRSLSDVVNSLVNINECTLEGTKISVIASDMSTAYGFLNKEKQLAVITNGVMHNFASRTGANIDIGKEYNSGKGLRLQATVYVDSMGLGAVNGSIYAYIKTIGKSPSQFSVDFDYAESLLEEGAIKVQYVAMDTYGMVIDMWVRTNAKGTYLSLEGNVLTQTEEVRATGLDVNGQEIELWTLTVASEDSEAYSFDLYQDAQGNWYRASTHAPVDLSTYGDDVEPMEKWTEKITVTGYEGADRVWERGEGDQAFQGVDPTTQGSGSCYIYYADTPEDQAKSLELLKAMKVAFIDANGKLMATASMDSEHYYAESGRVIVPLVLDRTGSINLGTDVEGNEILAISAMEQNVPLRVTALVYLDGSELENADVMAASDIQGQLNIQFGTSDPVDAAMNEPLYYEVRAISASLDNTSFDYDTADDMTTNVTITVDGAQPSSIKGFFVRKINNAQGSREEVMEFTQQEDGTWTSSYTFTAPGNYVLRNVQVDGVDTVLKEVPTVTITGFGIETLDVQGFDSNNYLTMMTADSRYSTTSTLRFATDDPDKMPQKVQGRFIRSDGTTVNIDYVRNTTTNVWSGTAVFGSSGTYTLQFLILDGEYVELSESFWHTAKLYLGMKVAVETTSPIKFTYKPTEMTDAMWNLGMEVIIMDDTGAQMRGLTNVVLNYSGNMTAGLTWNAGKDCYTGALGTLGPGIFVFRNVTVGNGNTITRATQYPVFTIMSPDPPAFYANATAAEQIKVSGGGTMAIQITNSTAADCWAYIVNGSNVSKEDGEGKGTWVKGSRSTSYFNNEKGEPVSTFTFSVGDDAHWTITDLKLANVFDAEANQYDEENPMYLAMPSVVTTKVIRTITPIFQKDESQNFGWTVSADGKTKTLTGQFLQSYEIKGLNVILQDFESKPVSAVGNVKLRFYYEGGSEQDPKADASKAYGGRYTGPKATGEYFDIVLTQDSSITKLYAGTAYEKNVTAGTVYTQGDPVTIFYAGLYSTEFSFYVNGSLYKTYSGTSLPTNAPKFTVSSLSPSVTVTAVSPAAGTKFSTTKSSGGAVVEVAGVANAISTSGDHATVYMKATKSGLGNWSYTMPSVTLALGNVATFESASLVMVNEADNTVTHPFNFTPSKLSVTQTIGKSEGKTGAHDEKFLAGKTTFAEIPVKYNGMDIVAQLEKPVTVEQPEAPYTLSFGNVPMLVPEEDRPTTMTAEGSTVKVTFPRLTWTETSAADPQYSAWSGWTKVRNVRTDYSTYSQRVVFITYTRYNYYIWTEYSRTRNVTGSTTAQDMVIEKWVIDGETYLAGLTYEITLTKDSVATAVHSKYGNEYSLGETTVPETEYCYGYVAGATGQSSTPTGGKNIGTASGTSSAPAPKLYADGNTYTDINGYEAAWP